MSNKYDEAINHFQYGISHDIFSRSVAEYATTAIECIKERQERSKGCGYCNQDSKCIYEKIDKQCHSFNDYISIEGNSLVSDFGCKSYASAKINFCPMCGKSLTKENADEHV